jgi:uncharacterized protein YcbK (DUF882 family)
MSTPSHPARRHFLHRGLRQGGRLATLALPLAAAAPARAALGPTPAASATPAARALALAHTHTGERLALVFAEASSYLPPALQALNHFLRDHYSGAVGQMDPRLYDLLHAARTRLGAAGPFEVISGYREPATNERLQRTRGGGVATRSLHMDGRAVDVRLAGVALADLRDAAWALQGGGVGFYPDSGFVHIDTGRVRRW